MDEITKLAYFATIMFILPIFQNFIKKEDLSFGKSAFLVFFFTCVGFSATRAFPSVHGDIFTTWESWFMFSFFPISALLGIYMTKSHLFFNKKDRK